MDKRYLGRSRRNRIARKIGKILRIAIASVITVIALFALFMSCMYYKVNVAMQMALLAFGLIMLGCVGIIVSED